MEVADDNDAYVLVGYLLRPTDLVGRANVLSDSYLPRTTTRSANATVPVWSS